ncbi:ATP-dependent DNA helicase RecG [Candidatus Saccharibacteria bacterium]|nr:ATP-dependent DNA helicase RecG [Candidatus Saccharibacteria bacterium]
MNLHTSLANIKGVGPKTAEQFEISGLQSVQDLLYFLPRKHEDFSEISDIASLSPGKRTIKARCESINTKNVKRGMRVTTATLADTSGKVQAVWFNQAYRSTQLKDSKLEFFFSGEFEFNYNKYQLTNPSVEKVSDMPVQTDRLLPVYRSIKGLKSQVVRKILAELRPFITMVPETLPASIVNKYGLVSLSQALLGMHFPTQPSDVTNARRRLAFEELFELLLASQLNKLANAQLESWQVPFRQSIVKSFVDALPFELTGAQRRASWDILQDLERSVPMNRLLQGDVGAGKTVVAAIAARQAVDAGYQVALLAPTEILATQHARTISELLEPHGVTVALLTGSVKLKNRHHLFEELKSGGISVIVGTHALLEPGVQFHKLGLVVIDEQHRFGVNQRQRLLEKSAKMPHLLAMTATPIPRSLALTVYGELDVSVINQKPAERRPIRTKIWSPVSRKELYAHIDHQISEGRQAYVVCRLIDDNPANEAKSVETEFKKLQNSVFGHRRIGLLHGRMKSGDKESVMAQFLRHEIDILVSTTVVEVGVDVPNATAMLIEDADQYGLSQLHQLRGRVGRSSYQSYCYLLTSDTKKPTERLREVERSNDGFHLAEVDLRLRGPGEIYGRAQHGALNLQIASFGDTELIALAQVAARDFVKSDADLLQYKQLSTQVDKYQRLTTLN